MRPQEIEVPSEWWAQATLIGWLRKLSHDGIRAEANDRGKHNPLVDLMGAFGELCLYNAVLDEEEAVSYVRDHIYMSPKQLEGSKDEPDVSTSRFKWDVKTFDCAAKKNFFAINSSKHKRLDGNCDHYFCVVAPPLAKRAIQVLVPYDDVSTWKSFKLGASPSRNLPIDEFLTKYSPSSELCGDCYSIREVKTLRDSAELRRNLKSTFPKLPLKPKGT